MSHFSPSLQLAGMDYIAPSADCVRPTLLKGKQGGGNGVSEGSLAPVKITLQDCLACSGCVTTAETVLITQQSKEEILKCRSDDPTRPWLISISIQSASSLATHWGVTVPEAFSCIAGFFRAQCAGNDPSKLFVCDLLWAHTISATKTAEEYRRRLEKEEPLPLIVSACPGWVCYCEKQGSSLLPLLCPVLSPQGIAGSYAKRVVDRRVYHLSIQPCFDRKLEAARDTLEPECYYTDCVISTAELLNWMNQEVHGSSSPIGVWRGAMDSELLPLSDLGASLPLAYPPSVRESHIKSSEGYHLTCIREALQHHSAPLKDSVTYKTGRNHNLMMAQTAQLPNQQFCVAYGFQQIQNIVRGLNKKLASVRSYTFIELMACPGGCLNGGGQIHSKEDPEGLLQHVGEVFLSIEGGASSEEMTSLKRPRDLDEMQPFTRASIFHNINLLDKEWFRCTFTDRQKEFEEMMDQGNIHSLKW